MDQLFTLYDVFGALRDGGRHHRQQHAHVEVRPQRIAHHAADGGTDGSGAVGQLTDGQYYMVFDTNGGGVETLPNHAGTVDAGLAAAGLLGLWPTPGGDTAKKTLRNKL